MPRALLVLCFVLSLMATGCASSRGGADGGGFMDQRDSSNQWFTGMFPAMEDWLDDHPVLNGTLGTTVFLAAVVGATIGAVALGHWANSHFR